MPWFKWLKRGLALLNIHFIDEEEPHDVPGDRRVIKTAQTVRAINKGVRKGYRPLIKPVKPDPRIFCFLHIFQNPSTGMIDTSHDERDCPDGMKNIKMMQYYPYHFPNPFAAYLLPPDLAVGETVWLEDLIEDVPEDHQHVCRHRVDAAAAIWTGSDFDILYRSEPCMYACG
ncbi:MAG: hypothetical protein JWL77_1500 [Chthonomonadaceae bacterium]|nr:hypothetical protein [Chthonomonadaceae bacterium]